MSDTYLVFLHWLVYKFLSKSNKILILGPFLPKFWFQWSLNDWLNFYGQT